jgi:hypothetical protein
MADVAVALLALFAHMERVFMLERAAHARTVAAAKGKQPDGPASSPRPSSPPPEPRSPAANPSTRPHRPSGSAGPPSTATSPQTATNSRARRDLHLCPVTCRP